jgi:hypothetical protein
VICARISKSANLAWIPARREARKIQPIRDKVMGWRSQENYELTNERDLDRLPWRDRKIIQWPGWIAARTFDPNAEESVFFPRLVGG